LPVLLFPLLVSPPFSELYPPPSPDGGLSTCRPMNGATLVPAGLDTDIRMPKHIPLPHTTSCISIVYDITAFRGKMNVVWNRQAFPRPH